MNIITFKTIKIFKPTHKEGSFPSSHNCFWRFETREASLSTLGCVTLLTSNGGALIQRSKFFLLYLGGITSPSFSVSYIKASEHHFLLFSLQFVIFRASKHPNSSPIRSLIIFSKRDFNNPQELQRSVHALVYVSFTFTTSLISSDNLLGFSFSHP